MSSFDIPTRVVFFQVRDPASKLQKITETAQNHFEKKEPFLIVVEDDRALTFLDELLWKRPSFSFLPHFIAEEPTVDLVVITKVKKNLNHAKMAFNLCPTPLLIEGPFKIIYEFEDLTSSSKKQLSTSRFDAYKQARYLIEARELS